MTEEFNSLDAINKAALEAALAGVSSKAISSPNGGSRSVSLLSPAKILEAKKAIAADAGADILAKVSFSPLGVVYPNYFN